MTTEKGKKDEILLISNAQFLFITNLLLSKGDFKVQLFAETFLFDSPWVIREVMHDEKLNNLLAE